MSEINPQATQYRRIVTLDIETVPLDPFVAKGALDALTGRVVCIGLLIDDGKGLAELAIAEEDEAQILTKFWATIQPTDLIVGHNVHEFDIPFLRQRSWVLNIRPSRTIDLRKFYTADVWDSMQVWSNWGFKKFVALDTLGAALHCGQKTGHGEDVAQWWSIRDMDTIRRYCLADVKLAYAVFCRLTYQEARTPQAKPKAHGETTPVTRQPVCLSSNRRRSRRTSSLLPTQALEQPPTDPDRGSLALGTQQRDSQEESTCRK
jgi:predicted 3'-5' exonuclease similar to PolB exonuclease domain